MPWYNLSPFFKKEKKVLKVDRPNGAMGKISKVTEVVDIDFKIKRLRKPSPDIEEVINPELGVYRIETKTKKRAIEVALNFYKQWQRQRIQKAIEDATKEIKEKESDEQRSEDNDSVDQ